MHEDALIGLASIIVLGIGSQWLAWRLRLPSILLLLLAGFVAGPVSGLIDPDHLLGETLFPIVSISVGIILFEGGLTLRLTEIAGVRRVLVRLISVGMVITWAVATLGAYTIVGLDFDLALLLGAVFVVTGPTVVLPLLKFVRPRGPAGPILKWEGILIDPIGATLAVLVFEGVLAEQTQGSSAAVILTGILETAIVGGVSGLLGAALMIHVFKRYWVPEHLQNPFALMLVVGAFAVANAIQPESGLLTTTLMGVIVANQRSVSIKHLSQFKEDIGVLLLSGLFVILAARLDFESISNLSVRALLFVGLLIFVARPLAVMASTARSTLRWQDRVLLAWLAPRGIVAVAVASLFALRLTEAGRDGAEKIVPITFLVVVSTVIIYGLTISRVAHRLGLVLPQPRGVLMVGANRIARAIAHTLRDQGFFVLLVDTNYQRISEARLDGLDTAYASVLSEHILDEADLSSIGLLLALTPNDEVNSLSALRFREFVGHAKVFQLPLNSNNRGRKGIAMEQHGRFLFDPVATYNYLCDRIDSGAVVKAVKLTSEFGYPDFLELYGGEALPLFVITENDDLLVVARKDAETPRAGQTLIALVDPAEQNAARQPEQNERHAERQNVPAR